MTALGTTRGTLAPIKRAPLPLTGKFVTSCNSGFDRTNFGSGIQTMLATATGTTPSMVFSSIPGSSWTTRFDGPTNAQTGLPDPTQVPNNAKTNIASYDLLHLTNSSAMFNAVGDTHGSSEQYAAAIGPSTLWTDYAWANGRGGLGAEIMFWATWAPRGPVIEQSSLIRLDGWPRLAAYHNARVPLGKKPVRVIPGAWVWYKIWQDQVAGATPTAALHDSLFDPSELAGDGTPGNWHQSDKGEWLSAVLNLACVYGVDPLSLPTAMSSGYQTFRVPPTNAERLYLCGVIKGILANDPNNLFGVDTSGWG